MRFEYTVVFELCDDDEIVQESFNDVKNQFFENPKQNVCHNIWTHEKVEKWKVVEKFIN